jgi:hypothetical protein
MPRKVFVAGEILTAADVNTNLMDQAVMSFAGTAARGSAIPTPVEGMVTYLNDADRLEVYTNAWKPVGSVLQVVSTVKTDTFGSASTSYVDVTGLSVSITPSSTSSKVFVLAHVSFGGSANVTSSFQIVRNTTAIGIGDAAGSRIRASQAFRSTNANDMYTSSMGFLDSPATTSATTYKIQARCESVNFQVNRSNDDADSASFHRAASTITVWEIAG